MLWVNTNSFLNQFHGFSYHMYNIIYYQGWGRYFISVLRYKVKKVLGKSNEVQLESTLLENYLSKK